MVGASAGGSGGRRYREARVEPGQQVTILGLAVPFGDLDASDPSGIYDLSPSDPTIAAELDDARSAGGLADSPEEAWGNAAIPGFGIGEPVRPPELDPAARPSRSRPRRSPSESPTSSTRRTRRSWSQPDKRRRS